MQNYKHRVGRSEGLSIRHERSAQVRGQAPACWIAATSVCASIMILVIGVGPRFGCFQQLDPTAETSMTSQLQQPLGHDLDHNPEPTEKSSKLPANRSNEALNQPEAFLNTDEGPDA